MSLLAVASRKAEQNLTTANAPSPPSCERVKLVEKGTDAAAQVERGVGAVDHWLGRCRRTDIGAVQTWAIVTVHDPGCQSLVVDGDTVGLWNMQSSLYLSNTRANTDCRDLFGTTDKYCETNGPPGKKKAYPNAQFVVNCPGCKSCSWCDSVTFSQPRVHKCGGEALLCRPVQFKIHTTGSYWTVTPIH